MKALGGKKKEKERNNYPTGLAYYVHILDHNFNN
jgi:hypothetical protein